MRDIDRERALNAPERISNVVQYIRDHFDQKTMRKAKSYAFTRLMNVHEVASARDRAAVAEAKDKIRLSGFNSIFAVSSIDTAKLYYNEFKRQQAEIPESRRLKIATIYSYGANDPDLEMKTRKIPTDWMSRLVIFWKVQFAIIMRRLVQITTLVLNGFRIITKT